MHQPLSAVRRRGISAALAHHLGVGVDESFPRLELKRDLGLEPLDLVLFALAFEEADRPAFPFEDLERAATVGELVELLAGWLTQCDQDERDAEEDEAFDDRAAGEAAVRIKLSQHTHRRAS